MARRRSAVHRVDDDHNVWCSPESREIDAADCLACRHFSEILTRDGEVYVRCCRAEADEPEPVA